MPQQVMVPRGIGSFAFVLGMLGMLGANPPAGRCQEAAAATEAAQGAQTGSGAPAPQGASAATVEMSARQSSLEQGVPDAEATTGVATPVTPPSAPPEQPTSATAEQKPTGSDAEARLLGGHRFLLPMRFDPTFVMTHFGFRQGIAITQIRGVPVTDTSTGESKQGDVQLIGVTERFQLGVRALDWLGFFAGLQGQVVAGADPTSALARGALLDLAWDVGPTLRVFRDEELGTQAAVRLRFRQRMGREVLPSRATAVVDPLPGAARPEADEIEEAVLSQYTSNTAGLVLSGAQRLHRHVGIALDLEGRLGEAAFELSQMDGRVVTDAGRAVIAGALQFSADANPHVPLGFSLEFRHREVFDTADVDVANLDESRNSLGSGLFYTGRNALVLGVFTTYIFGQFFGESRDSFFAEFVIEYIF